jgi:hypothetical protein
MVRLDEQGIIELVKNVVKIAKMDVRYGGTTVGDRLDGYRFLCYLANEEVGDGNAIGAGGAQGNGDSATVRARD